MSNAKACKFKIGDKVVFTVERLEDISHSATGFTLSKAYVIDDIEIRPGYYNVCLRNDDGNTQSVLETDVRLASDKLNVAPQPANTTVMRVSLEKVGSICKLTIEGELSRKEVESLMDVVYFGEKP